MRVLLVEDDPLIGSGLEEGLRHEGFAVDWVRDGDAASLALRTTPYGLMLLDLACPGGTACPCSVHCGAATMPCRRS